MVPEAARVYIDREIAKGRIIEDFRRDELQFQKDLLIMKQETERTLDPNEVIFFDRGIPDSYAYYKICNVVFDNELEVAMSQCEYKKVFLFQMLDYKKDYARVEDKETAQKLEKLLEESYQRSGTPIVYVPKMSVGKRLEKILKNI